MKVLAVFLTLLQGTTATWWFLQQLKVASVGGAMGGGGEGTSAAAVCDKMDGLTRRQRRLCLAHPDVMSAVAEGVRLGVVECQRQFSNDRWNCSAVDDVGFGKVLLKMGSREAAFVYAVSSAGVVHAVARACADGRVADCGCGQRTAVTAARLHRRAATAAATPLTFEWGGCADNVRYASHFARRFVDANDRRSRDSRALMNLHNNRVGRKAVKRTMKLQCKCHGVSGSCTTKTCWRAVGDFGHVGGLLVRKYRTAVQVAMNPSGARLVSSRPLLSGSPSVRRFDAPLGVPARKASELAHSPLARRSFGAGEKDVSRNDMVFLEPSPDYCESDHHTGSPGTAGRRCNRTTSGADSCEVLCCGRGYDTKRVVVAEQCECKFIWCCEVQCATCKRVVDVHTCKPAAYRPTTHSTMMVPTRRRQFTRYGSRPTKLT